MFRLVDTLVQTMSHVFPEIKEQQEHIKRVIKNEEEGFNQTLDNGIKLFDQIVGEAVEKKLGLNGYLIVYDFNVDTGKKIPWIEKDTKSHDSPIYPLQDALLKKIARIPPKGWSADLNKLVIEPPMVSGADAFKLYDTFGFPLDLTQLMAAERGLTVDEVMFTQLMEKQKARSRESGKMSGVPGILNFMHEDSTVGSSLFLGYDQFETEATITSFAESFVTLDKTPFYAEAGGQVGDTGELQFSGGTLHVIDTQKNGNIIGHKVAEEIGEAFVKKILAKVDQPRRLSIMRNHTATHLVHAALRKVLGTHVHQAGSLVAPEHLRFDFAHFSKVSEQELAEIENIVNEKITENIQLQHWRNIPFEEAQKMGALMFFGDKYGDKVNVVQFDDFSKEFCGGTHVKNTSDIGFFKIRSETSSASGVRRIEAITNEYAVEFLKNENKTYKELVERGYQLIDEIQSLQKDLVRLSSGASPLSKEETLNLDIELRKMEQIPEAPTAIVTAKLSEEFSELHQRSRKLEDYILMLAEKKKSFEKELAKYNLKSASSDIEALIVKATSINGFKLVTSKVTAADMDTLKSIGDTLRSKIGSGVGLLASIIDDKVALVCVVSDDLIKTKNIQAGKIVGAVAKIVGGGGGGKPHLATAGGKDVAKLDEALKGVAAVVEGMMEQVKSEK
jgi:alanyl-tRNA synthetase